MFPACSSTFYNFSYELSFIQILYVVAAYQVSTRLWRKCVISKLCLKTHLKLLKLLYSCEWQWTVANYNPTITYDTLPVSRRKQLLVDYYTKLWNATYINSEKASYTKPLIPSIFHRMSLPLWPNHILTQLLKTTAAFANNSIKWKRRPHHSVAALKRPNKRHDISW